MKAFTIFSSVLALATVAVAAQSPVDNEIEARSPMDSQYSNHFKRSSGKPGKKKIGGSGGGDDEENQNSTAISLTPGWKWVGAGVVLAGVAVNV